MEHHSLSIDSKHYTKTMVSASVLNPTLLIDDNPSFSISYIVVLAPISDEIQFYKFKANI